MVERPKFLQEFVAAPLQQQLAAIVKEEARARREWPLLARPHRGRPPKEAWAVTEPRLEGMKSVMHTVSVLTLFEERGLLSPELLQALKGPGAPR